MICMSIQYIYIYIYINIEREFGWGMLVFPVMDIAVCELLSAFAWVCKLFPPHRGNNANPTTPKSNPSSTPVPNANRVGSSWKAAGNTVESPS